MSPEEVTEVRELLDAHEHGLARETLAAILDDDKALSCAKVEDIQTLSQRMNIAHEAPIAALLTRLAPRQRP